MKKKSILAFLLVLLAIPLCLNAQDNLASEKKDVHKEVGTDFLFRSYFYNFPNLQKFQFGNRKPNSNYSVAIQLTQDKLQGLKGNKIVGVRFFIGKLLGEREGKIFVKSAPANNATIYISKDVTFSEGWNEILFDTPVLIEKDKYTVGWEMTGCHKDDEPVCVVDQPIIVGTCWAKWTTNWFDMGDFYGVPIIQTILQVQDPAEFKNKMQYRVIAPVKSYFNTGEIAQLQFQGDNEGVNEITSFTWEANFNGEITSHEETSSVAIGGALSQTVSLQLPHGQNNFTVKVTKINGQDVSIGDQTTLLGGCDQQDLFESNPLLEVFTGEWCGWCPLGKFYIGKAIEALSDAEQRRVIVSYIHDGDFISNTYPAVANTASFLESVYRVSGFPSCILNRTKNSKFGGIVGSPTKGLDYVKKALKINLDKKEAGSISVDLKKELNSFTANFSGKIAMPLANQRFYVSAYLIRDGIAPKNQNNYVNKPEMMGAYSNLYEEYNSFWKSYLHDHTLLQLVTNVEGEEIILDEQGNFSMTKSFTPDFGSLNSDHTYLVVILHHNNRSKRGIINSVKIDINSPTPIETVVSENDSISIWAHDGSILTSEVSTQIDVYTIDGKAILNRNLPTGVYVARVKLLNGTVLVSKVFVP